MLDGPLVGLWSRSAQGQVFRAQPGLVEVLRDYGYVEARGMGVRRKIVPQVRALTGRDAEFEATQDHLRLTLPAAAPRS